jgi:hypothetical protein
MVAGEPQHTHSIQTMPPHIFLGNPHGRIPTAIVHNNDFICEVRPLPVSPLLEIPASPACIWSCSWQKQHPHTYLFFLLLPDPFLEGLIAMLLYRLVKGIRPYGALVWLCTLDLAGGLG